MSRTIEDHIRAAAQSLSGQYSLPSHIVEEDLVSALMPEIKKMACPHVVQPDAKEGTQYCRLAENEAQRLRELEGCIHGAEKIGLHIIPPSISLGHKWTALYRVNEGGCLKWITREFPTFGNLIMSLPSD